MSALMLPFRPGSIRGWLLPQATLCGGKGIVRDAPKIKADLENFREIIQKYKKRFKKRKRNIQITQKLRIFDLAHKNFIEV